MNPKKYIKLVKALYEQGQYRLAQKVLDLADSRQMRNKEILKKMKEEDKWKSIAEQHRVDRPTLYSEEPSSLLLPEGAPSPSRRVEVEVLYPSFDDKGAPFFDEEEGIQETLIVASSELAELENEEEMGYLKILSTKKLYPKS